MANSFNKQKFEIKIENILGGHAPTTHFAQANQFRNSLGINPALPIADSTLNAYSRVASGLLRPTAATDISSTVVNRSPKWMKSNPKNKLIYVYGGTGSVYTINAGITAVSALGDLTDGGTSQANGMEYYDNYMYFARSTTVARYGPLDGTPSFTDDYWVTTLSKTALIDTQYPTDTYAGVEFPNHILHRHSDGRLYFADVVGNKGTIHYIATTKTTVEGDTDNGSTYGALDLGYGLWPTALESYGTDICIALYEGSGVNTNASRRGNAKIAFWDTTSLSPNTLIWVEFPDQIITGLKNVNGVLYVISGDVNSQGFRISRFVGGYSVEEIYFSESGQAPFPGAILGRANTLWFGTISDIPETAPSVLSWGLQKSNLGAGLFNIMRGTGTARVVMSMVENPKSEYFENLLPIIGCSLDGDNGVDTTIDVPSATYSNGPQVFWSQTYRIGQPFKITKIRIPLAQAVAANMTVTPKIYTDDGAGTTYTLTTINNTNFPNSERNIIIRPTNATCQHDFWLELRWTGSALCTVGLPITIEYELLDD